MTVDMAQKLLSKFGCSREQVEQVDCVGYNDGEISNVMSVFGDEGNYLANIAYRPHMIGTDKNTYDEHGLFIC